MCFKECCGSSVFIDSRWHVVWYGVMWCAIVCNVVWWFVAVCVVMVGLSPAKERVAAAGWLEPTTMTREEILRDMLTGLPRRAGQGRRREEKVW